MSRHGRHHASRHPRPGERKAWTFHQRRIAKWIGAGIALVVIVMLFLPIRRPPLDFRQLPPESSEVGAASRDLAAYRETRWYELAPQGWDPYKSARELRRKGTSLDDSDPRAVALLKQLHDLWDNAPINPALDGADIRIPGYVVTLDEDDAGVREFLLVPYFGACIHTPPPPSNQILHVIAAKPLKGLRSMANVWVSGHLKAERSDSSMGMSSYVMRVSDVRPYVRPQS